jgi:hypothetical protein
MYSRTRRPTAPLSRRQKRFMAVAGALLIAVIAGVSAWALSSPGSYDRSRAGCVTVNLPSSTGGGIQHACGGAARAMCHDAFTRADENALAIQRQCRLAGIGPAGANTPAPATGQG